MEGTSGLFKERFDPVYWAAACSYFPKLSLKYRVKPLNLKKE